MEAYLYSLATFAALNVILALGLNLISGFCGQVSLGHAWSRSRVRRSC